MNSSKLIWSVIFLIVIGACTSRHEIEQKGFPNEATFQLEQIYSVSEFDDSYYVPYIGSVSVLKNGNLIIKSHTNTELLELSTDGKLLSTIGRSGRGPGEFVYIDHFVVSPNDSLHVFDRSLNRQQIFSKNDETSNWELVESVELEKIPTDKEFILDFPQKIYSSDGSSFLVVFHSRPHFSDTTNQIYGTLVATDFSLNPIDVTRVIKPIDDSPIERSTVQVWKATFTDVRKGFYHYLPSSNEILYLNNVDIALWKFDLNGTVLDTVELPYDRIDNTENKSKLIENLRKGYENTRLNLVESKILDVKPYITHVLVSDEELLIKFNRQNPDSLNYGMFTHQGENIGYFHLSDEIIPLAMVGRTLYTFKRGSEGNELSAFSIKVLNHN